MKKLLSAAVALLAAASIFTGCNEKNKKIRIGAIQLIEHPALDKSYQGFVDGLAEEGYVNGENIVIDYC